MTLERIRTLSGYFLMAFAIGMIVIGIKDRKTLWKGFQTKVVTKEVVTVKEVPSSIPIPEQEAPKAGQQYTGPLKIQNKYEITSSRLPSGDYQVLDQSNKIWMMKLCEAKNNGVLPDFTIGETVDILYTQGDKCYDFISAKLIKEDK